MPPTNPSAIADEIAAFRGTTEEVIEALAGTFRPSRIAVATLGLAATFVAALGFGAYAGVLVLRNSMEAAAFTGILAGVVLYAGKLLTYGALCRMAAVERQGETLAPGAAFSFAFSRAHTLLGLPLFALLVALGLGLLGVKIGFEAGDSQTLGSGLGAVVVILVFVLNFFLLCAVLVSHILTAPCVACTDRPFSAVGERLIQLFHEQLHQFLACQVPVLLAGLPVLLLS